MKKHLALAGLVLALTASAASAQTFERGVGAPRRRPPLQAAPPISGTTTGGVIPRALAAGNPLQVLNPRAPAEYGRGNENVTHDPANPAKPKGIKFFELLF